jgi:DNA-binding transcriptional LysR family regulator
MNPVESRPLRHFVAVAQELSFARAAERLAISAPALSRTVAQLEAQLGVALLTRSTRQVALTEAGSVLLDQAQLALAALDAAAHRAQRAGQAQHRLVLAFKADLDGGLLEETIAAYGREHPGTPLEVLLCGWGEQARLLREGRADVALVYHPHERFDERELDFEVLLEEPQLVALPAAHPLAARGALRLADLQAGYERSPGTVLWRRRGAEESAQERPRIGDMSQLLKLVELDQLIALLPASVAARFGRPQIAYRPVLDAPPATLAVGWPRNSSSLATAALVRVIGDLAAARGREQATPPGALAQARIDP